MVMATEILIEFAQFYRHRQPTEPTSAKWSTKIVKADRFRIRDVMILRGIDRRDLRDDELSAVEFTLTFLINATRRAPRKTALGK